MTQNEPCENPRSTRSTIAARIWLASAALLVACAAMQVFASNASACSYPAESPVSIKMENSDQVFSGRVASIEEYRTTWFSDEREAIVEFRVSEVWKGQAYERMFVKQYRNIPSAFRTFFEFSYHGCDNGGGSFTERGRYLVFVRDGVAYVGNTGASSKPYESAVKDGDIAELGAGVTPEPGTISPMPKANRLLPFKLPFWISGRNIFYAMLAAAAILCFSVAGVGVYRHMRGQTRY